MPVPNPHAQVPDLNQIEITRHAHGIPRIAVCDRAGVSLSTWTRWRSGKTSPNTKTLERLNTALLELVTVAEILRVSDDKPAGVAAAFEPPPAPEVSSAAESPDTPLLALAPELEAAANARLGYERDLDVTSADPDYQEALDTSAKLSRTLMGVAERVFAHSPKTLAGLLVIAHAAAATAEQAWDESPEFTSWDGDALRCLANGLFGLFGVDWRGRPLPFAASLPENPVLPAPDADLLALGARFDAAHAAWLALTPAARAVHERAAALIEGIRRAGRVPDLDDLSAACADGRAAHRSEADAFDRLAPLLPAIRDARALTPAGLAVKARALACAAWPQGTYELDRGEDEDFPTDHVRDLIESACALVGLDWRGRRTADAGSAPAAGADPPAEDTALIEAAAELDRLDAAIEDELAQGSGHGFEDNPTSRAMDRRRTKVLHTLCRVKARSAAGIVAKARALRTPELLNDYERLGKLAVAIAKDIDRLAPVLTAARSGVASAPPRYAMAAE